MAFREGDFLEVEYSAWTAADNGMISTTDERKAKEGKIFDEHMKYGPVLIVVGSNSVIKGLDRSLREMSVGETKRLSFKPDDAFGERNPDLVKIMPIAEFRKRDMDPYPGMQLNIDNQTATVKAVNSGRVTVDMNHPYSGQEIIYEVKVVGQLSDDREKIKALGRTYGAEPDAVEKSGSSVTVKYGNGTKKNADYFVGKANMIASVFTYMKDIEKVDVDEEYKRPKESEDAQDK